MELFKANSQWSSRPSDERFESLESMHEQTSAYAATARESTVPVANLRTEKVDSDVVITRGGNSAKLTHWAFGQLSARVGAPADYLRKLPPTLASNNLNHGLSKLADKDASAQLLFHQNGSLLLRAITSEKYSRIWNHEVIARMLNLQRMGWEPARPDTHWGSSDVGSCIMCSGLGSTTNTDGDNGNEPTHTTTCKYCKGTGRELPALYASDHDMFAFIRAKNNRIREDGNPDGLQRGFIVENSEVGAASLRMTRFLYREMCGNHIIWGASNVREIAIRHVGEFARGRFDSVYSAEFRRYAESSAQAEEEMIARTKTLQIAGTKDAVLDKLFGMKALKLSLKTLTAGYDAVVPEQDGSPNTVWGMVQGLTRHSQTTGFADTRTAIDKAAGKLLEAEGF